MSSAGEARGVVTGRGSRLPRWTRQEILVLIEGKRVVERSGRGRGRGRARGGCGDGAAEPTKWAAVAEYCRRHGVDRGPVQCRKRWSNLAGDYKKIREWERGAAVAAGKEASFWAMRNDARRERRLPGFFDSEVYEILEGRAGNNAAAAAALPVAVDVESKGEVAAALDGGRGAEGAGLFSSSEDEDDQEDDAATPSPTPTPTPAPVALPLPIPEKEKTADVPRQESSEQDTWRFDGEHPLSSSLFKSLKDSEPMENTGTSKRKQPEQIAEDSPARCGQKRQRSGDEASGRAATTDLQGRLVEILDRSSQMVAEQLEVQNNNSRLDREQRKEQVGSLLGVLGKVADALCRIADKL